MSLDQAYDILSWPPGALDTFRLSVRRQVMRVTLKIGTKALLDGKLGRGASRERDRQRALDKLSPGFRARLRDGAAPRI